MKKLLLTGIIAASTSAQSLPIFNGGGMYWAIQNNSPYIIRAVEAGHDWTSGFNFITANPGSKSKVVEERVRTLQAIQGIDLINVTLNQKIAHVEIIIYDHPFGPGILPNTVSGVTEIKFGNTEVNPNSYVSISYTGIDVITNPFRSDTFGDIVIN